VTEVQTIIEKVATVNQTVILPCHIDDFDPHPNLQVVSQSI